MSKIEKTIENAFDKAIREIYELRNMRSESDMRKGAQIFRNALLFEIETQKARR